MLGLEGYSVGLKELKLNEAGTVFYVVVPSGSIAPTAVQVLAGTGAVGVTQVSSGEVDVFAGVVSIAIVDENVAPSTTYDVYTIARDVQPIPNVQSELIVFSLTTTADVTAPVWQGLYPRTDNVQDFAFDVLVQLDEAGLFHYVVLKEGKATPTAADVVAGTDGVGGVGHRAAAPLHEGVAWQQRLGRGAARQHQRRNRRQTLVEHVAAAAAADHPNTLLRPDCNRDELQHARVILAAQVDGCARDLQP